MSAQILDDHLATVERLLDATGQSLVRGDALALEQQSAVVREAMSVLAQASRRVPVAPEPALRERLAAVSRKLAQQREALARRNAVAERALAAVLPQSGSPTYAAPASAGGFKGSVARVYANAAP